MPQECLCWAATVKAHLYNFRLSGVWSYSVSDNSIFTSSLFTITYNLITLGCRQAVRHRTLTPGFRWFEPNHPSQKKALRKKCFFHDVCLRQMMSHGLWCWLRQWWRFANVNANIASLRNKVKQHHFCEANTSYRLRRCIIQIPFWREGIYFISQFPKWIISHSATAEYFTWK